MSIEAMLVPWATSTLAVRAVTEIPADLAAVAPLLRFLRVGGVADPSNPNFDAPRVVVDSFAVGFGPAGDLAARVEHAMRVLLPGVTLPAGGAGTATVTRVDTVSGPSWVPYADTALRHFVATYGLHVMNR